MCLGGWLARVDSSDRERELEGGERGGVGGEREKKTETDREGGRACRCCVLPCYRLRFCVYLCADLATCRTEVHLSVCVCVFLLVAVTCVGKEG